MCLTLNSESKKTGTVATKILRDSPCADTERQQEGGGAWERQGGQGRCDLSLGMWQSPQHQHQVHAAALIHRSKQAWTPVHVHREQGEPPTSASSP